MALINLFTHTPSPDREPVLHDRGQILAYLEQLFRLRTVMSLKIVGTDDVAYGACVEAVSEGKASFTLSLMSRPSQEPKSGTVIQLWFALDGRRFRLSATFIRRCGYMQSEFHLPECIHLAERRASRRGRFTARENAQVVALESFTQGTGASGQLLNLGVGGLSFRVDKAMDIQLDRRLPLRGDLLSVGMPLSLVRLQDLPQTPMLQFSGVVRHCDLRPEGLVVGLSFEAIGGVELRVVEHLLSRKLRAVVASFPRKPRLGEEPLSEEEAELEPGLDEEAALTQEEVSPEAALCDGEIEDLRNTIRSPDRQTLLRKRSRQILIVVGDDLERAALLGNLYGDGYRCVYEARGLVQALERAKKHAVDLFILDQQVGPHTALQILERLRAAGWMTQAKVVVLKEKEDVRLALATKAGGVAMVVPRPLDFHAVLKPGLETLLELA